MSVVKIIIFTFPPPQSCYVMWPFRGVSLPPSVSVAHTTSWKPTVMAKGDDDIQMFGIGHFDNTIASVISSNIECVKVTNPGLVTLM